MVDVDMDWLQTFAEFILFGPGQTCPTIILHGGAGSGKTHHILREFISRLFNRPSGYVGLIVRKTGPSLKKSVWPESFKILNLEGFREGVDFTANKGELTLRCKGNVLYFYSFGSEIEATSARERIKSMNITDAYINEATELSREEMMLIRSRLRVPTGCKTPNQLWMDFNPTNPYHWTKTEMLDMADYRQRTDYDKLVCIKEGDPVRCRIADMHSTYLDNPTLSKTYERDSLAPYERIDPAYYKIYALGEYAQVRNVIYFNYDITPWPEWDYPFCFGLDFGFNDPSALIGIWVRDGELYLKEFVYETQLTATDIAKKIKNNFNERWLSIPVFCDSARPDMILDLQRAGIAARESKKDVIDGIDTVKRFKLHVHRDSSNLIKEIRSYKWNEDRDGNPVDKPVKMNDHLMDAMRYAIASSALAIPGSNSFEPRTSAIKKTAPPRFPTTISPQARGGKFPGLM